MKPVPIARAREIGKHHDAERVVIFAIAADGQFSITSYGATRAICGRLGKWVDSPECLAVVQEIDDQ